MLNPNPTEVLTYAWLSGLDEAEAKRLTLAGLDPEGSVSVVRALRGYLSAVKESQKLGLTLTKR